MKRVIYSFILLLALLILPVTVNALTAQQIASEGEVIFKSVPLTSDSDLFQFNEYLYEKYNFGLTNCNSTYTSCSIFNGQDDSDIVADDIEIKYEYDETVKEIVDGIMAKIPSGGKTFYVEDIYMIKYILDQEKLDEVDEFNEGLAPIKYSPEFNSFIGYNNFAFEPRMGDDTMYAHFQEGTHQFSYDDTIYGYGHFISRANNIVYVADDETNIEGALKERLSKYFNIDNVTVDNTVTITDMINDHMTQFEDSYDECMQNTSPDPLDVCVLYSSKSDYLDAMYDEVTDTTDYEALWNFKDKVLPNPYVITFSDGSVQSGIPVFVIKDSSKLTTQDLEVKTRDTKSGITINNIGTSKKLPFDTLIKVSKLTSGTDYEKIISVIESLIVSNDVEMFDLKLFSNSIEDYITKLDDGSFEVKIPISDSLKDEENLVVYYVDGDKVEEHEVTVKKIDGKYYAVFSTNHFSIYTLAIKKSNSQNTTSQTSITTETTAAQTASETNATTIKKSNPQTNDNIIVYFELMLVSIVGFAYSINKVKKTN